MKKKVVSIILIISIIFININVFAVSSEYQDAQKKQSAAREQLEDVKDAKSKELQEIETLQENIEKAENEISELNTKINNLNTSITEKSKQIKDKEKEYEEKENLLKDRMVEMYELGQTSYLEVLLTSTSITNFISRYYLMSEVAESDTNMLNEIENTKKEIEETKQTLENEQKEVEKAKNEKTEKNKTLIANKNQKQEKVNSLNEEEKKLQSEIEEYNNTMKRISELERIEAARRTNQSSNTNKNNTSTGSTTQGTISGTGKLTWPIPGYTNITSYYGYRIHPVYGIYKLHNGIDVGAPKGAKFVAADDGEVILAEYYGGYGNCVVISHGNGLFTRYGHGTSILVSKGQKVTRGTPVLTVGSTGISTGNHAHFEVSINGVTVNPLNYL